ncbi:hypothetical protein C5B96_11335, partial [Subtercola sp. Z020]
PGTPGDGTAAAPAANATPTPARGTVILVGAVGKSAAFARQLADATATLHVQAPRILHAATLDEAIDLQNHPSAPFGRGEALHSLDPTEVEHWLARVEGADLFVNAAITPAVVGRRPTGGGRRSSSGPSMKADGPNALLSLGRWHAEPSPASPDLGLGTLDPKVRELIDAATAGLDWQQFDFARRGALSDHEAFTAQFAARDVAGLGVERNVLRHRPEPVVIRLSEGEPLELLVRILAAGTRARASLGVSTALKLPRPLRALLKERRVRVFVENDEAWLERAAKVGDGPSRIRMIGGSPSALSEALGGSLDVAVWAGDVTTAGRVELLPFLSEQTVTVTNHRFSGPSPLGEVRIG